MEYDFPETVGNVIGPQLTFSPSFFRGVGRKTTKQILVCPKIGYPLVN